jgi:hypothetical protein
MMVLHHQQGWTRLNEAESHVIPASEYLPFVSKLTACRDPLGS